MEKAGYREALTLLTERFPNRVAISVKEAAEVIGATEGTIRDAIRKGNTFPSSRIGGRIVIPLSSLARWMC